jgi:LPXTG-motif cell wall-anchored protein
LAANEVLINTAHLTHNKVTISDKAETKIVVKTVPVVPTTTLPKTGSTTALSFIMTFMAGIVFLYMRYRKMINSEEVLIINSLVA